MRQLTAVFFSSVMTVTLSAAPLSLDLAKTKNRVEFLAVGSPSAIKIRGKIKDEKPALRGGLSVDGTGVTGTAKIALDEFDTGIELRNKHMKEKYLETAKYPDAELTLTKLPLPAGDAIDVNDVPFEGLLTLHGVKKPISGKANVKKAAGNVAMDFDFKFTLADYGVETPSFMGVKVTDDVRVTVALQAEAPAK